MPKMKTHSAASKRFRYTGTGRIRRGKAGAKHLLRGKSDARRRRLRKNDMVHETLEKRIRRLLPNGTP
ncbi:MAG: 50S ribosomal protein L35 [Deltaproteobacteria bacterium]|nr:50S ribosomal protein L35 [Deltaproteobacteria bacterium]